MALITQVMKIYCFLINYTTPGNLPINLIKKLTVLCVVLINIGENIFLNYLYQQLYSVLLNIIGVTFSNFPVNMYIRNSLL